MVAFLQHKTNARPLTTYVRTLCLLSSLCLQQRLQQVLERCSKEETSTTWATIYTEDGAAIFRMTSAPLLGSTFGSQSSPPQRSIACGLTRYIDNSSYQSCMRVICSRFVPRPHMVLPQVPLSRGLQGACVVREKAEWAGSCEAVTVKPSLLEAPFKIGMRLREREGFGTGPPGSKQAVLTMAHMNS